MKNPSRFKFKIKNNILNIINSNVFIDNGNFKKSLKFMHANSIYLRESLVLLQ